MEIVDYDFEDTKDQYGKRKMEVMDEEEIKFANRLLDHYRASHQDKDNRGLFERWETIDLYWEGEAHTPDNDNDPNSNTNIINSAVEGQVAYLVEQNIAIEAKPRGPSDMPFAEKAANLMEWCKEQNKLKRKLDVHERRREKFGVGIFRVLFDPDALGGFGLPRIEPCNPAYVFCDPVITDIYKVQEGRFMIEVMPKSIEWAKDNFDEDRAGAIMPGYHPMEHDYLFGEDEGENDLISKDSYLHMFVWSRYTDEEGEKQLRLVQMSGCGVILQDSKDDDESFYPSPLYPYFFTPCMYREGTVWAKSTAELLVGTQDLIDDIDDQVRMNARLTGNPQRMIDINSDIDPDKVTNEPGLAYPTTDINGMKFLEPPNMANYIIERRRYALEYERQVVSRFSDQMAGVREKGVDTATEALALQQSGTQGINHKKLLLEETLSEIFEYCLELMMEYYTVEQAFRITETDEFMWMRPSDMKEVPRLMKASDSYRERFMSEFPDAEEIPEWMEVPGATKKAEFDITVTVGAGLPSNKAFVYNAIKEARRDRAISLAEYRKLLKDYVSLPVEDEIPPELMQELGIQPQQGVLPNELIQGLGGGGSPMNPQLNVMRGGMGSG